MTAATHPAAAAPAHTSAPSAPPAPTLRGLLIWPCGSWRSFCSAGRFVGRYLPGADAGWQERS